MIDPPPIPREYRQIDPAVTLEIERLTELLDGDAATGKDLVRLVSLLRDSGETKAADDILRRNVILFDKGRDYPDVAEERCEMLFDAAVSSFCKQFRLRLTPVGEDGFLDIRYRTGGGKPQADEFEILAAPCDVRIVFDESGRVEADVYSIDPFQRGPTSEENRRFLFLTFVNGEWAPTDPFEE